MEQSYSTSKVTVEYFDPHDVFKLLAPGLVPRLPLRNLHWQSHAGPLRSIDTLHIELLSAGDKTSVTSPVPSPHASGNHLDTVVSRDDGFQTQIGAKLSSDGLDQTANRNSAPARRHQIPGLRRTPYLKVLLVRCDDNDSYKGHVRQDIRDWIKTNTPPSGSKRNTAENHDAFEWLIIHVIIPNTVAATQPRDSGSAPEKTSAVSKWRPGSSTLFEKLRSDFNTSSKGGVDRIAQIRIGVNDVPYDILPRVVPAVPSGYSETEQETENSWTDLVSKFRSLILSSFDLRVSQYEEDIREKDSQRTLPGWNFCTFFILKEGLARGFESVGLVEDALVGYDELSVGLDMIVKDQTSTGSRSATNALLSYTAELKQIALQARATITGSEYEDEDEMVDLQSQAEGAQPKDIYDDIPISSTKKPYRDLIVANNVSVFDFRCYIFARQISLLLRLGNACSTREELLAKLKEQQESVLHGVAPRAPPPKQKENEHEDLTMLAEICRRTLEFIPTVSQVMRNDVFAALSDMAKADGDDTSKPSQADPTVEEVVENLVASFAFSIAQQILAQTSTKALPIPPSSLASQGANEQKAAIPEPKTMMHPARNTSLSIRTERGASVGRPLPSPNIFPGRRPSGADDQAQSSFLKAGLEELAARRAELYMLSRNILAECGKKRGWADGWDSVPVIGESTMVEMVDIDLNDDDDDGDDDNDNGDGDEKAEAEDEETSASRETVVSISGVDSKLLKTALDSKDDFYRLYETLTDKALRHYTVADHTHSVKTSMADIAVLKYHLCDYAAASSYFWETIPFFGESGWSLLELSMLVMCSRCLKQLQRKDEYIKVMLKLLTKAAAAERDRLRQKSGFRLGKQEDVDYPDSEAIKGFLDDLLAATKTLPNELRISLSSFISIVEVDGPPEYHQGRDGISLNLKVNSLLADSFRVEGVRVRVVSAVNKSSKDIWFELAEPTTIKPGRNKLKLNSNSAIPGSYEIDKVDFKASNIHLHHEREAGQPVDKASDTLQSPYLAIYHRSETLDVKLRASKHIQLDRNNTVDIDLDSGWNDLLNAEIRVKAATGGLRLLTSEAKCINSSINFSKKPEGGLFCFAAIPRNNTVRIRFPYTVEQETLSISIRIEVSYSTGDGSFFFSKTPVVETALALGVNVQDVFKHKALFSRFTVSTASQSPLRLFTSELVGSEAFESEFGVPPSAPVIIFPKQPASLLYKITRKVDVKINPKTKKTMYLRLRYSMLQEEIESLIEDSITESLEDKPLRPFSRLICSTIIPHVRHGLTGHDLERAVLLGSVPTTFLSSVNWAKYFVGLGKAPDGTDYSKALVSFLRSWQAANPKLELETSSIPAEPRSILIPVDIPSLTIVHTADIRLQQSPQKSSSSSALSTLPNSPTPTVCTNQLLPAVLHLKWTRVWDTTTPPAEQNDLEFSYELAAPQDTWLLGGRRKGHFVIPAPSSLPPSATGTGASVKVDYESTADTEAEIPILFVPLREGWLPYPSVEIREVRPYEDSVGSPVDGGAGPGVHFETDVRNLGETVRVIADRARVTLSLDASGPSGGPLVLDVERLRGAGEEGRTVA
ncbi:trafficking protein particle complex subunit 10 [Annulohypoxylon maeteangense]|uniref:trafficking protein particle complex subunit 10 n=1 Tax=Annulohypoxylon maeteangense TaxID=1927788 RepID=UPI002007E9A6|nr:trafficking protein particle complex subunit 10 [Annulohypoxylon maeteangense]KAI0890760.1 trafficking protein particle complex subunit 10 [Annulohypoxylon maeteangense]